MSHGKTLDAPYLDEISLQINDEVRPVASFPTPSAGYVLVHERGRHRLHLLCHRRSTTALSGIINCAELVVLIHITIMSWFSILPAHLTVIETWLIRFFVNVLPMKHTENGSLPFPPASLRHRYDRTMGHHDCLRSPPLYCSLNYIRNPLLRR